MQWEVKTVMPLTWQHWFRISEMKTRWSVPRHCDHLSGLDRKRKRLYRH